MSKQLWTPTETLNRIRELKEAGHDLAYGNALQVAPRVVAAARRYFGSWGHALEQIGVDYAAVVELGRQRASDKRSKWSKERIIQRIREMAAKNEPLNTAVVSLKHTDIYSAACSSRYFGGWSKALEAAGVSAKQDGPYRPIGLTLTLAKWRNELLLERIGQLSRPDGSIDEQIVRTLAPALHDASIRRFGSWGKTLHAIKNVSEQANSDTEQTSQI